MLGLVSNEKFPEPLIVILSEKASLVGMVVLSVSAFIEKEPTAPVKSDVCPLGSALTLIVTGLLSMCFCSTLCRGPKIPAP